MILKEPKYIINSIIALSEGRFIGDSNDFLSKSKVKFIELEELVSSFGKMETKVNKAKSAIKFQDYSDEEISDLKALFISFLTDGTITGINGTVLSESERLGREIIGKNILTRLTGEDDVESIDFLSLKIKEILETKRKVHFSSDRVYQTSDGNTEREVYQLTLIPYFDEFGEVKELLLCSVDVKSMTLEKERLIKQHELEKSKLENIYDEVTEELNVAMKELVNNQKLSSLGSLVAGVAHEINTPLGIAVSAASFLKETHEINIRKIEENRLSKEDLMDYIDTMSKTIDILENSLRKSADLVKNFKALAVSQSIEEKIIFNLTELVKNVVLSLRYEYKGMDVEFTFDCPHELKINNYPGLFSQILTSVIINSLRHGVKGKAEAEIEIKLRSKNDRVRIEISDNGIGIEEENIDKIFDPFYTTNRSAESSGLGLSVVYNIVTNQLGGRIKCESIPNVKTSFLIDVPLIS